MANRSDFWSTSEKCPRLPRYYKKMLALQPTGDAHRDGELRRLFIDAHQSHVAYRKKVASGKVGTHDDGGDE
jgi:hypothetical protein